MSSIPIEWLRAFHKFERELFIRFVFDMGKDPTQSMQIIAFWLWLEEIGFPNIISELRTLSDRAVDLIIEEAESCLNCLRPDVRSDIDQNNIPFTEGFMDGSISLQFLNENRDVAILGISSVLKKVCFRIFEDLLPKAVGNAGQTRMKPASDFSPHSELGVNMGLGEDVFPIGGIGPFGKGRSVQGVDLGQLMRRHSPWQRPPGEANTSRQGASLSAAGIFMGSGLEPFVRPTDINLPPSGLFGHRHSLSGIPELAPGDGAVKLTQLLSDLNPFGGGIMAPFPGGISTNNDPSMQSALNPSAQPWAPEDEVSQEDRTMFLTFSRGYPLNEEDIRDFFRRHWGECIQSLRMQETPPGVQPLFSRLVLYSSATIPMILGGRDKAKLVIKGKHVWVRPYIPKKKRSPSIESVA